MLIAIDVDDVCANLVDTWLELYNREWNDSLRKDRVTNWDIGSFTKCGKAMYGYLDVPGLYDLIDPIIGALDGVNELRGDGHRIIFVTTPTDGSAGAKMRWLMEHGFLSDKKDYVECRDKSLILADVLIDDAPHNLLGFHGRRVQFLQPWNNLEFVPGAYIASGWAGIPQIIHDIKEEENF